MSYLEVRNITAGYGKKNVVENISFSAGPGTLTCILGANGSGKTTLLRSLCGLLPHKGSCTLDGQDLGTLSPRKIARLCRYAGQRSGMHIDISLLDLVLMGFNPWLGLLEKPNEAMAKEARAALARVGLEDRQEENYQNLSEGQKQLCILARTLAGGGKLLLLDEPESALDIRHRRELMKLLRDWVGEQGRLGVLILHDPALALEGCDQLVLLKEGRVSAVLHPKTDSLSQMEGALSEIYGPVTLTRCADKTGMDHLVMLKEDGS